MKLSYSKIVIVFLSALSMSTASSEPTIVADYAPIYVQYAGGMIDEQSEIAKKGIPAGMNSYDLGIVAGILGSWANRSQRRAQAFATLQAFDYLNQNADDVPSRILKRWSCVALESPDSNCRPTMVTGPDLVLGDEIEVLPNQSSGSFSAIAIDTWMTSPILRKYDHIMQSSASIKYLQSDDDGLSVALSLFVLQYVEPTVELKLSPFYSNPKKTKDREIRKRELSRAHWLGDNPQPMRDVVSNFVELVAYTIDLAASQGTDPHSVPEWDDWVDSLPEVLEVFPKKRS